MIRAWAGGLCALAVAAAMVRILAPDGSMGKMLKLIVGAMALCAIIGPLLKLTPQNFSTLQQFPETSASSDFSALVKSQMKTAMEKQGETVAAAVLKNAKISYKEIEVVMDTSQPQNIHITKVTVTLCDGTQKARTESLLKQALGTAVEVKISG